LILRMKYLFSLMQYESNHFVLIITGLDPIKSKFSDSFRNRETREREPALRLL